MSMDVALVLDGDQSGAKKALEDTTSGIAKLEEVAGKASAPLRDIPEVLQEATTEAAKTETAMADLGGAAETTGGRFTGFKELAIGAIGGIAGSMVTTGIQLAVGALATSAGEFVGHLISSAPQIETALTTHAQLVKDIKNAYGEAQGAASSYGNNSVALLRFRQQESLGELNEGFNRGQDELLSGRWLGSNSLQAGQGPAGSPLQALVADFRAEMRAGQADIIAFRNAVAEMAEQMPEDDPGRRYAAALIEDTAKLAEVQAEISRGNDLLAALRGDADAAATALGGTTEKYTALGVSAGSAIDPLRTVNGLLAETGRLQSQAVLPIGPGISTGSGFQIGGGFAAGGWTGDMPTDQVAGFVHGREYVFDAASTARIGVGNLEAIRRGISGYAMGGYVGSTGAASGSLPAIGEILNGLQAASGAVNQFVRDLWQTRDPLTALGSVIANVIQQTSQSFLNSAVNGLANFAGNAVGNLANNAFGGSQLRLGFQAGIGHTGATIGRSPQTRLVDASLFDNAPRHHTGTDRLEPGEVPFIGKEGEEIGWPAELARKYGGGSIVNYWNIETPSPRAFMESRASLARAGARLTGSAWRHG